MPIHTPETLNDLPVTDSSSSEEASSVSLNKAIDTTGEEDTTTTDEGSGSWELSFMFEAELPLRREQYQFETPDGRRLKVVLDTADDEPGALQSGHYIWPASKLLADYLVENYYNLPQQQQLLSPAVVVELGAGCSLCSCTAWQLWAQALQCLVVTDHDPGTLERARNNHETTLEDLLDKESSEDDLNATINNIGSIPTCFEPLEWGSARDLQAVQDLIAEHSVPMQHHANYVLGSDLIYDITVVEPLLVTAHTLLKDGGHGVFLLAQSFTFDEETEIEIERCCQELGFSRKTVMEEDEGNHRIQEFCLLTANILATE
mmetsp:Transcript_6780/g.8786  ORF Transcript_6780/g.8786 Transcript_6780/m.8786 type:complete len:318 (-) Transcript_6780:180-1133(-)